MTSAAGADPYPTHLVAQHMPRMPFSSPMGEEILTPASPNTPHSSPHKRRKNAEEPSMKGSDQSRNGNFSSLKSPKRQLSRRQEKEFKNTRWAGLNVVTSFSKSPITAPSGKGPDNKSPRRILPQALNAQPGFVALSDIKAPINNKGDRGFTAHKRNKSSVGTMKSDLELRNRTGTDEDQGSNPVRGTEGLGLQPLESSPAYEAGIFKDKKGRVNSLQNSPTKLTELSPSDAPIVIGISVPSAKLAEHSISPGAAPTPKIAARYINDQDFPDTPTIVVTPARYQGPWHYPPDDPASTKRGRRQPSSSLDSRANQYGNDAAAGRGIPPIPTPPQEHFRSEHAISTNPAQNTDATVPCERPESSCTVFDEDDNPLVPSQPERSYSSESRRQILNRSSLDTIATKRRSQGWWNYIVSPFIARSNTASFGGWAVRAVSPRPALPSPNQGGISPFAHQLSSPSTATPPSVLDSRTAEKDHSSNWVDLKKIEAERLKIGLPSDQILETGGPLERPRLLEKSDGSKSSESFEGFGAAAEYFNACWHDQNSPNPYFDCENHICILLAHDDCLTPDVPGSHISGVSSPDKSKENNFPAAVTGFHQEPVNRFSAAFSQATDSRRRAFSEATDIEDVDATPVLHEARAAPLFRAGPPIAAIPTAVPAASFAAGSVAAPVAGPTAATTTAIKEAVHQVSQVHDSGTTPATNSPSLPAKCFAPLASTKASLDSALSSAPIGVAVAHHASSLGPELPVSREAAGGDPQQQPAHSFSRSEIPPEKSITLNPTNQVYPMLEPYPSSQPYPWNSKTGESPKQAELGRDVPNENLIVPAQNTYIVNHYYDHSGSSKQQNKVSLADMEPPFVFNPKVSTKREQLENDGSRPREHKSRNSAKLRRCFQRDKTRMTMKKKRLLLGISATLVIIIILIVVLAMTLTRKGKDLEVESQWLKITGFPPIPTGISTIVQPDIVREESGCIQPATVWSCALPKEEQESVAPNEPNQPNFRVEIGFRNGTATGPTSTSATSVEKRSVKVGSNPVSAGSFIRGQYLRIRDAHTDSLFSPSPAPPTQEDQVFLGNTTDSNEAPFDGESTPFFMSFLPALKLPAQRLMKRQERDGENDTDPFPDITKAIPPPDTNADGTAAAANLLPFPVAQPVRLYNRGLASEHYGFYTYYDRSIFLKSTSLLNDTGPTLGEVPADQVGGADKSAATVRCTWRQTRFLVQIWTNSGAAAPLLGSSNATSDKSKERVDGKDLGSSSANDFVRPGSFPYPVSITLDRHGGALDKKFIYCYGLDSRGRILLEQKKIQLEDRVFGGTLVNPALGPFKTVKVSKKEGGPGGIDGGSGGCGCQWRNWGGPFGTSGAGRG